MNVRIRSGGQVEMTREQLEAHAKQVMEDVVILLRGGQMIDPGFRLHVAGAWRDFPMPPGTGHLLNDGAAKRQLFGWLRCYVAEHHADAFLMVSDMWGIRKTPAGERVPPLDFDAAVDRGFQRIVELGWGKRCEVVSVVAQTATDVLNIHQQYWRVGSSFKLLDQWNYWLLQSQFTGRSKMFGDLREENLGENPRDQLRR